LGDTIDFTKKVVDPSSSLPQETDLKKLGFFRGRFFYKIEGGTVSLQRFTFWETLWQRISNPFRLSQKTLLIDSKWDLLTIDKLTLLSNRCITTAANTENVVHPSAESDPTPSSVVAQALSIPVDLTSPPPPVSSSSNTALGVDCALAKEAIDILKAFTGAEQGATQSPISEKVDKTLLKAWLARQDDNYIVNIQSASAFGVRGQRPQAGGVAKKIGLKFNAEGQLLSIFIGGQNIQIGEETLEVAISRIKADKETEAYLQWVKPILSKIKAYRDENRPIQQLPVEVLVNMISYITQHQRLSNKPFEFELGGVTYLCWLNPVLQVLNIQASIPFKQEQNEQKIGIQITDGAIISFYVNGIQGTTNKIPDAFLPQLEEAGMRMLADINFVANQNILKIAISRAHIPLFGSYILNRCIEAFGPFLNEAQVLPNADVKFIGELGEDDSGLSREFLTSLFDSVCNPETSSVIIKENETTPFPTPVSATSYDHQKNPRYPQLSPEEKRTFENMGKMLGYCFGHADLVIGRRFNDTLFEIISTLSLDQVNSENLDIEVQKKIAKTIALSRNGDTLQAFAKILDTPEDARTDDDWRMIASCIEFMPGMEREKFSDQDFEEISLNAGLLRGNRAQLQPYIENFLLWNLCREIPPMHMMAKGMRSVVGSRALPASAVLSDNIQGKINKEYLISKVVSRNPILLDVCNFLKEWIQQATEEDLKRFLIYLTGGPSLPLNKNITLNYSSNRDLLFPPSHTCFCALDFNENPLSIDNLDYSSQEKFNQVMQVTISGATVFTRG
jgi:HECT-domain (ubiquitin-transferase)